MAKATPAALARAASSKVLAGTNNIVTPEMLFTGLERMREAVAQYHSIREHEQTKRVDIEAQKEVALERIRSERAIIEQALSSDAMARNTALVGHFNVLDKVLETGNVEALHVVMESLNRTIEKSPLKDLAELQSKLANKDFVFELK